MTRTPPSKPRRRAATSAAALATAICIATALSSGPAAAQDLPTPLRPGDFAAADPAEIRLGRLLFYDPILSGNRNISCATCHHPRFATGDGLALGLGEGGRGLGPDRVPDPLNRPERRIPRNAPPLFNLGHRGVTALFADGRIERDPDRPAGLRTPLGGDMSRGFSGILSAQTMFPVLSPDEMAGHYQENDVAKAVRQGRLTGPGGAWDLIAARVAAIAAYRALFAAAGREPGAIGFTDISDAIAAFMAFEWRADDSPFDRHLRGDAPLTGAAADGMALFFGSAGCANCHAGPLLSDQRYHAMAAPQIGPGKAEPYERYQRDTGRMRVTGLARDAYAFRTPMLRNVARTGPWGHAGAHRDLRAFLRDHADPVAGLGRYRPDAVLPVLPGAAADWAILDDPAERGAIAAAVVHRGRSLTGRELDRLMAFLDALTDTRALSGRLGIPAQVPSGLPVAR